LSLKTLAGILRPFASVAAVGLETGVRDMRQVTVNHAERQNLNVCLFNRRFTRLTLGF